MLRSAVRQHIRKALSFQQTRTYAEKSVAVDFDWDEIGKLVHSEEGKRELASLRSTVFDIQSRFEAATKKVPTIDWESWKKQIDPAVVESFKKAFESMKPPAYEPKNTAEVDAQFTDILKDAEEFAAASVERVKELEVELEAIKKEKERLLTATVDEELAADPKLAQKIDAELEKNSYMVSP